MPDAPSWAACSAIARDERVAAATSLLGDGGVGAIAELLRRNGFKLCAARPQQLRAVPGHQWSMRFVTCATAHDGTPLTVPITVEARRNARVLPPPHPTVALRVPLREPCAKVGNLWAWAFPYDPDMPDLAPACFGPDVRDALRDSGVVARNARFSVSCVLLRYRPGRRAVLRYNLVGVRGASAPRVVYGKVLRPHRAERLYTSLRELRGGRPWLRQNDRPRLALPRPLFGGAMATLPVGGEPLRRRLLENGSLPNPARIAGVVAYLASLTPRSPQTHMINDHRDPARLAGHATRVLGHALPDAKADVARVADAVAQGLSAEPMELRLAHGDLYDEQIFVDEGYTLGVIDVDDIGLSDPVLDGANLCAHLLVLAIGHPQAAARLTAYRRLVAAELARQLDASPAALAWREALALLMLATGPLRLLHPRWPAETRRILGLAVRLVQGS